MCLNMRGVLLFRSIVVSMVAPSILGCQKMLAILSSPVISSVTGCQMPAMPFLYHPWGSEFSMSLVMFTVTATPTLSFSKPGSALLDATITASRFFPPNRTSSVTSTSNGPNIPTCEPTLFPFQ